MNDAVAGFGIVAIAMMFFPTLIAMFGARRILPVLGVGILNVFSVMMLIPMVLIAAIFWFVALFIALGASNRTRRDKQHDELVKLMARPNSAKVRIEPELYSGSPKTAESSWWPVSEKRK